MSSRLVRWQFLGALALSSAACGGASGGQAAVGGSSGLTGSASGPASGPSGTSGSPGQGIGPSGSQELTGDMGATGHPGSSGSFGVSGAGTTGTSGGVGGSGSGGMGSASGGVSSSGSAGAGGKTGSSVGSSGTQGATGSLASSGGAGMSGSGGATGGGGTTGSTTSGPTAGGGSSCKGIMSSVTTATPSGASLSVSIDVSGSSGCTLAPDFAGTNYESFPGWGADVSMDAFQQQAFKAAGTELFRYPGGEPGEWVDLLMTGKCSDNSNANYSAPPYTSLWTFAQSAGLHSLMLQTNPTTQYCGTGDQDSSGTHAAAIASDAAAHGVNAVYEVGNEPDISGSYFGTHGGQAAYIAKFIEHANAIHGVRPSAEVYGPVVCGLGANCSFPASWDSGWIDAFLAQTGNKATGAGKGSASGISFHVYWHPEWNYSDLQQAKIDKYGFAQYWAQTVMPYLRAVIAKRDTRDLPIVISEISVGNGIASDTSQTQNAFSVLETLDVIGAFAASGVRSFQWFDANAAGPNDFWMITTSKARPVYYSFVAWSKMGNTVLDVTSSANPHDVAAYATKKADGSVQILLINKTNSAHAVTLAFTGFSPAGKALQVYSAGPATEGSDLSTSMIYNGATDPVPSALPAPVTTTNAGASPSYTVPAYSLAVLAFGP